MSHQPQELSAPASEPSNVTGISYATRNSNGCTYYICNVCFLTSLDQNTVEKHQHESNPAKLQCFACANLFFSRHSLLSHAIHDHQMAEPCAITLINKLLPPTDETKNSPKESDISQQNNDTKILNATSVPLTPLLPQKSPSPEIQLVPIPAHETLDISSQLEREIINDLNDGEPDSDIDDDYLPDIPDQHTEKKNPRKKKIQVTGFKCDIEGCNVRLLAQENIVYHKKCHNSDPKNGSEVFRCPECQELSNRWNTMAGHLWRSHLVDMELHTCDLCNYKTPSLSRLTNQHRGIHGSERPFVCEFCGKGFKTSKQLRTHRMSHKANDKNTFECDKCQRVFKTCRLLKLHNNSVHRDCKPFTCHFCDYSAATRSGLKLHLRRHTGEKPFSCDQCPYSTGDHNSIRRHKLRHLGLKPYNCPHCSYACIQSSTYKVHLKNKHPGLDDGIMFSCQYCSFRTLKQEKLLTHTTKHTQPSSARNNNANNDKV